jgi:hypothetical protein
MTFKKRLMEVRFELGTGDFGDGKSNAVTFKSPIRMRADITYAGDTSMGNLALRVYGIPLDIMAKLTVLNKQGLGYVRKNIVTVSAGDDENGLSACFSGAIMEAWADLRSSPDSMLVLSAFTGPDQTFMPIKPTSYRGTVDVATVLAGLAAQCNPRLTLENSGVNVQISNPYLAGNLFDQIKTIATQANINCVINPDGAGSVLAIWPKGKERNGQIATISKDTGLVGYPAFSQNGIQLSTLYNPSLTFGRRVNIQSVLPQASGVWRIDHVSHNLESETPNGAWFTSIECGLLGAPVGIR